MALPERLRTQCRAGLLSGQRLHPWTRDGLLYCCFADRLLRQAQGHRYVRSCSLAKILYKAGSTTRVSNVLDTSPPITTVARGFCTSAPVPVANAMGTNPKEATRAVINTGRRRVMAPCMMASS